MLVRRRPHLDSSSTSKATSYSVKRTASKSSQASSGRCRLWTCWVSTASTRGAE